MTKDNDDLIRPGFANPKTELDLFLGIAHSVEREGPGNIVTPWRGWLTAFEGGRGWHDAVSRIKSFESNRVGEVSWKPLSETENNSGPMSDQTDVKKAIAEVIANAIDANLELKALAAIEAGERLPGTPEEAVERWFGVKSENIAKMSKEEDATLRETITKKLVVVRTFVKHHKDDDRDMIIDVRDVGIGLSPSEMPNTILATSRGVKRTKPYLIGQHGQGGSSIHPFTIFTVFASRKVGSNEVAITVVKRGWQPGSNNPTFFYLVINDRVPSFLLPSDIEFPVGTLVRLIGVPLGDRLGSTHRGTYELINRLFPKALFPIWHEHRSGIAIPGEHSERRKNPPYYGNRDSVKGTIHALERGYFNPEGVKIRSLIIPPGGRKVDHVIKLGTCTPVDGSEPYDMGTVQLRWWAVKKPDSVKDSPLDGYVDTNNNILVTVNSQTHAELPRKYITSEDDGAGLSLLGRYMVVQLDCDLLSTITKYDLFPSNRNGMIDGTVKSKIIASMIHRLKNDPDLRRLNEELVYRPIKTSEEETFAALLKQYLDDNNLSFDTYKEKVKSGGKGRDRGKTPLEPIPINDPPTTISWRVSHPEIHMYPGQRYGWTFETDAPPHYWDPCENGPNIRILTTQPTLVEFEGGESIHGGRAKCTFHCSDKAKIGSTVQIQAQLRLPLGQLIMSPLTVTVVEKQTRSLGGRKNPGTDGYTIEDTPYLAPIPVTRNGDNSQWDAIGWPDDPDEVGFKIMKVSGQVSMYYNAEAPFFINTKRDLDRRSLGDAFKLRYEVKLAILALFILRSDRIEEDSLEPTLRTKFNRDRYAVARLAALSAKEEVEKEAIIKRFEGQQ